MSSTNLCLCLRTTSAEPNSNEEGWIWSIITGVGYFPSWTFPLEILLVRGERRENVRISSNNISDGTVLNDAVSFQRRARMPIKVCLRVKVWTMSAASLTLKHTPGITGIVDTWWRVVWHARGVSVVHTNHAYYLSSCYYHPILFDGFRKLIR